MVLSLADAMSVCVRQIIMQPQRDSKDTRAQMLMRDDPSAPAPVQKPQVPLSEVITYCGRSMVTDSGSTRNSLT